MGFASEILFLAQMKNNQNHNMTKNDISVILDRLDRIEKELGDIKVELAETRGAYRLAKFIIALLGISGLGGVLAWLNGNK